MTIIVYSKTVCPYCQMAKQYLTERAIDYTEVVFDDDQQRQQMYDDLGLIGNERTVPQVLIETDGRRSRIGGYRDLLRSDLAVAFDEEF